MQYALTLTALAASALAVATPDIFGRSTFSVNQVATGKKVLKSGPVAMAKALNKHGIAPAKVLAAASAAQTGSVPANPETYDDVYLVPVTAGNSKLNLDFDTGSADLWVFSKDTPSSQSSGHDLYIPSSSGVKKAGYTWSIGYGDGSGSRGIVYSDKVIVGGVTATSQAIEAATSVSSGFSEDTLNDGLLGLSFSTLNTVHPKQQTTFFDTVKSTLAKPLFTVALKHQRAGTYDFGYIDTQKFTGPITYVPVDNSQGYWGFTAGSGIGHAIADTGTALLLVSNGDIVKNYYASIKGSHFDDYQNGYTFPCTTTPPDFSIEIGGYTAVIPGPIMNYAQADYEGEFCYGGLQIGGTSGGGSIFGDIFLKSQFVVFDQTTSSPRLGFAKPSSL
ncbi:Hypothetical protein R9X50_00632600 [Acrodontium crateriforme]|uniref:Peptidase A1 domain-containing protein n=1 Tax=Acrodontium crateriforme TaxID=150365 RepID=A0AAQ3MBD6_9PEZI|nr:Hypothetical protein R9X50_00632600 [Acrodontium crateriforme]